MIKRILLLCCLPSIVTAAPACREVVLDENDVITIEASLNHATHLILPEPITRDVPGNTSLWTFAGARPGSTDDPMHYWVKPGDDTTEGESTSLSLLTMSRSFDFVLKRVERVTAPCVRINEPDTLGRGAIAAAAPAPRSGAALPAFTRYRWKGTGVESVFDDGRFTYLRLAPRAEGAELPIVTGGTKRSPQIIEANYDALTLTFKIPGVHRQLLVAIDGRNVPVERGDD